MQRIQGLTPIQQGAGFNLREYKSEPIRIIRELIDDVPELTVASIVQQLLGSDDEASRQVAKMLEASTSKEDLITVLDTATTKFQVDALMTAVLFTINPNAGFNLQGEPTPSGYFSTGIMI